MEENFRASMMPAYEDFIKILSNSFADNSSAGWNLWRLELPLLKAVQALAVRALVLLIETTQGTGYSGARRSCRGCGGPMKFENCRKRQLLSSFGFISYERAYYYCGVCGQGWMPLDEELELSGRMVTPRLQRVIGYLAGHLLFGVVAQTLKELQQIEVNREVVRQVAEASGEQALEWERAEETNELLARAESSPGRHELLKREIVARRCTAAEFAGPFWSAMQRAGV